MMSMSKIFLASWIALFFSHAEFSSGYGEAQADVLVTVVDIVGNHRTKRDWVIEYLDLQLPTRLSEADLDSMKSKLLTTEVFTAVKLRFEKRDEDSMLTIELTEKWTTIPVVRATYGGGTPLTMIGIYDTHSFGRLWTLGGEVQRYGTAPWGGVMWARAPRYRQGLDERGLELWRQYRIRGVYDSNDERIASVRADHSMVRVLAMTSNRLIGSKAKIGLDLRYREESRTRFEPDSHSSSVEKPKNLRSQDTQQKQFSPSFRAIYDDMIVDHLQHRGFRTIVHSGPIFEETGTHARHDIEVFAFDDFSNADVNLGFHLFMGKTTSQSYESQFYLGGFDSVRGLPDGVMYGSTAAYANFELRFIAHRMKYAWFQTATFFDVGSASDRIGELSRESRSSAGVGLRIAVPQVYRLLLRLDYAWSCDDTGSSGVSLGMNQFFQPYKPL